MSKIDEIMSDVQSFASTWALFGGRLDDGSMYNVVESKSAALRNLITAALADAESKGAEQMRAEAMDCAVNAGRGSLAEEIAAIPTPSPGVLPLPTGSQPAEAAVIHAGWRLLAWAHEDGRVIRGETMETAKRDGGATLSSVSGYTIPLYAAPAVLP